MSAGKGGEGGVPLGFGALLICGHTWPQPNCSPHLQKTDPGLPPPVPESGTLLRAGSVTVLKFQF